jgi:hypothetical protein
MKRYLPLLLLLTACFSRASLMTRESFDSIDLGTSVTQLRTEAGEPYAIYSLAGDKEEYEYIERINMGNRLVSENHYFLTISNGQVVSKRSTSVQPPAYNILYQTDPNYSSYP